MCTDCLPNWPPAIDIATRARWPDATQCAAFSGSVVCQGSRAC